jgi:hypothetical protein
MGLFDSEYSGDIIPIYKVPNLAAFAVSEAGWAGASQAGLADFSGEITHSANPGLQIVQAASLPPITAKYISIHKIKFATTRSATFGSLVL